LLYITIIFNAKQYKYQATVRSSLISSSTIKPSVLLIDYNNKLKCLRAILH